MRMNYIAPHDSDEDRVQRASSLIIHDILHGKIHGNYPSWRLMPPALLARYLPPKCDIVLVNHINTMTHYDLCFKWRNAPIGDKLLAGPAGDYFKWRLFVFYGGFTPELSKRVGWEV